MTLRRRNQLLATFILLLPLLHTTGCARGRTSETAQNTTAPAAKPASIALR